MMSDRKAALAALGQSSALTIETVQSVRHWNEHLFSFSITRPASFRFRSGEFVMVGLPLEGKPLLRAYSIASPSWAEELEFLSIKVPYGPLTSQLQHVEVGDPILLGRKPTGTLVADALTPGRRLFLFATGTGLAPFLSLIRDPDIYERFSQVVVVHCVRQVSDLAFREELEGHLAGDPLVQDQALLQLIYVPTVTREAFHTMGRINDRERPPVRRPRRPCRARPGDRPRDAVRQHGDDQGFDRDARGARIRRRFQQPPC